MKPLQLRDIWSSEIVKHDGEARIECLSWMSRVTLDIIGLAGKLFYPIFYHVLKASISGFNYKFNALTTDPEKDELMKAFSILTGQGQRISVIPSLRAMYPALRFLVRISAFLLVHFII